MRGSIYYQTSVLAKIVFKDGLKKQNKVDSLSENFNKVSSFQTMDTYRQIWNNFGLFLRFMYQIKDFEKVRGQHIESYMMSKINLQKDKSKQYFEKISAALGKLEFALNKFSLEVRNKKSLYDFSIRKPILNYIRNADLCYDGYHNRVYQSPKFIIENLDRYEHKLAAKIQLSGGCRYEGIFKIDKKQLKGYLKDKVSGQDIGIVKTKEKGGKTGDVNLSINIYSELEEYIKQNQVFSINYQAYAKDIRDTCKRLNISGEGSHGFRWTFAQNRIREYQKFGYTYDQALLGLSHETKHNRIQISEHYLGGK